MSTTTTRSDPIRDDVERALHGIVDVTLALPLAVWGRAWRCARHQVGATGDRLAAPVQLVRSLVELATGGVDVEPELTRTDAPAPARGAPGAIAAEPDVEPDAVAPAAARAAKTTPTGGPAGTVTSDELPIEQYESLAASQVVARLGGLSPDELERVQAFEAATRGRRTVLGRIERLLADA